MSERYFDFRRALFSDLREHLLPLLHLSTVTFVMTELMLIESHSVHVLVVFNDLAGQLSQSLFWDNE